jgi:hypothetical protein
MELAANCHGFRSFIKDQSIFSMVSIGSCKRNEISSSSFIVRSQVWKQNEAGLSLLKCPLRPQCRVSWKNIAAGLPRRRTFRQTSEKNGMALFSASIDVKVFSFRLFRKNASGFQGRTTPGGYPRVDFSVSLTAYPGVI